jgi:transcriptional regulator with XRE-family HTH domain
MVQGRSARPLAARLDKLFQTVHRPNGGEYAYEEVAAALRARGGPTISATYIWQLRTGKRDNPTKSHLEALAEFFGVSPAYFFDEAAAARVEAQLELLGAMRDSGVSQIALRSFGLSSGMLDAIAQIIENARKAEGLPAAREGKQARRSRTPRRSEGV